jgi:hypothetical protein
VQLTIERRILVGFVAILLIFFGFAESMHSHASQAVDCALCVASHHPAAPAPTIFLEIEFHAALAGIIPASASVASTVVSADFIRPPPSVA